MSFLAYDTADDIISSLEIIEKLLFPETDFWHDNYLKGLHFEKNSKISLKWKNEPKLFFLLQNDYFYRKADKRHLKNTCMKIKFIDFSKSYD